MKDTLSIVTNVLRSYLPRRVGAETWLGSDQHILKAGLQSVQAAMITGQGYASIYFYCQRVPIALVASETNVAGAPNASVAVQLVLKNTRAAQSSPSSPLSRTTITISTH